MKVLLLGAFFAMSVASAAEAAELPDDPEQDANLRAFARETSGLTSRLEEFIATRLVGELGYSEFPPARQYQFHDIDGDGSRDLLLITRFGLPSGGNYEQSELLVALSSDRVVRRVTLGGRGTRVADSIFMDNGLMHVFVRYSVWARSDAQCCPSLSSTDEVVVEDGEVRLRPFAEIRREG